MKGVLIRMALLMAAAMARPAGAEWPQFMGPTGDGIASPEEKIAKSFPAGGPKELWHVTMADGYASPAVAGGKVYVLDRPGEGATEKFRVLDLATGNEEWSVDHEAEAFKKGAYGFTRGTPAVDGTMAYAIGTTGDLTAYDLPGKRLAWKKNLKKDFGARPFNWGFSTSPVVLGEHLIVFTPGSPKSGVVALDKKTGDTVWASEPFGAVDTNTSPVVATIDQVPQILAWHTGTLAGISPDDGKILWRYDWKANRQIPNPVYLGNGRIFLPTGHKMGCAMVDVKRVGDQWQVKEVFKDTRTGGLLSNTVFYKGFIYINATDKWTGLQCIDMDGNLKWEGKQKFGYGSMIVVDGTIVIMNGDNGTVFLVEASPAGYKELASAKVFDASKEVWSPLAVASGKLLVRDKATLKCLDVAAK